MGQTVRVSGWKAKQLTRFAKGAKAKTVFAANERTSSVVLIGTFGATLFLSAALLFIVEPMVAKMLLPYLGGAPAVWTTCMVFFQALMLGGYLYAHFLNKKFRVLTQTHIHIGLLLVAAITLPVGVSSQWMNLSRFAPVIAVFGVLCLTVGLPFFALSATAPLLQSWFAHSGHTASKNPYFLYGASNLGSFLALFSYPVIVEPSFGLGNQSRYWAIGFGALVLLMVACRKWLVVAGAGNVAVVAATNQARAVEEEDVEPLTYKQMAKWVALAFAPSSLMLGVTTYFTTDIATIPLLWTIPLGLYLLSFIIVFSKWPERIHNLCKYLMPPVIIVVLFQILGRPSLSVGVSLFWHLSAFFLVTMVCHGEMAKTRPNAKHLTTFYLLMSFGGMLGGMFNALAAPYLFTSAAEYPLGLVIACFLVGFEPEQETKKWKIWAQRGLDIVIPVLVGITTRWLIMNPWSQKSVLSNLLEVLGIHFYEMGYVLAALLCAWLVFFKRPIRLGLGVGAFTLIGLLAADAGKLVVYKDRSFFGILKVTDSYYGDRRTLTHGTTLHGTQFLDPAYENEPLTYYHKNGPVGSIFDEMKARNAKPELAFIGLGTGTLATYGQPEQKLTYYEIDDAVVKIATNYFTYLKNSKANWQIVMGDARLKLQQAKPNQYGVIMVDAFSSDAIPVHLLTREAIQLYLSKLAPGGVIGIHTSNRYLALEPILGRLAKEARLEVRVNSDRADDNSGKFSSTWVVLARTADDLGGLANNSHWEKLEGYSWTPLWTDDFTSLFGALKSF